MRSAEAAKFWAALQKAPQRPVQLRRFDFAGLPGVADGTVDFQSPLTALCGLNGSGKSAVLRALWATLDWDHAARRPEVAGRLRGSKLKASTATKGAEAECSLVLDADPPNAVGIGITTELLDMAQLAPFLQQAFYDFEVTQLLDAYDPIKLSATEVAEISYICKKGYLEIEIFEIDEFGDPLPFVKVRDEGAEYDIRTMSMGEIALICFYWKLRRAPAGSVICIEEPETFVSPASQMALMDFIVMTCVRNALTIVMTTHSPTIFGRLREEQVRFMYKSPGGARVAATTQFAHMRQMLGFRVASDWAVLVEDRGAREFTRLLFAKLDISLSVRAEVIDVGSAGQVSAVTGAVPRRLRSMSVLALYDGDMKSAVQASKDGWPVAFLPGESAPEHMFRMIATSRSELIAEKAGREETEVAAVFSMLGGLDDHDWFEELAKLIGMTYEQLMMVCFEAWFAVDANREAASGFLEGLEFMRM